MGKRVASPAPRRGSIVRVESAAVEILDTSPPGGLPVARLWRAVHAACPDIPENTVKRYLVKLMSEGRTLKRLRDGVAGLGPELPELLLSGEASAQLGEQGYYAGFAEFVAELEGCATSLVVGGNRLGERWGTPDVIAVRRLLPGVLSGGEVQVISGELKCDPGKLCQGFGQASAYRLFSHVVYLAVPRTASRSDLRRLQRMCEHGGVGLVLFTPAREPRWELRYKPLPVAPELAYAQEKLAQLPELFV